MKRMKRIFSLTLALALCIGLLPISARAEGESEPATPSITVEPASSVYTGSAHTPTVTVNVGGTTYTTGFRPAFSPSELINAGTYEVTVQDTDSTDGVELSGTASYVITPAAPGVQAPTAKTLTYSGGSQELINAGTATNGIMRYAVGETAPSDNSYTEVIPSATDAGNYKVWYKVFGNTNYANTDPAAVSVEIKPLATEVQIVQMTSDTTLYHTTLPSDVGFSYGSGDIEGIIALTDTALTVGTKDYSWKFTPTSSNYAPSTGTISLTVVEDTVTELTITGTLQKTGYCFGEFIDLNGVTVTAKYTSGYSQDVTANVASQPLAVGQTQVAITYGGQSATITGITVDKAEVPNIEYPTASAINYGQSLANSTLSGGSTQYGTFAWKDSTISPGAVGTAPYTVVFTPSQASLQNYQFDANREYSETVSVTVNKAPATPTVPAAITATYGDTLSQVTIPQATDGSWAWKTPTDTVGAAGGARSHVAIFTPTDTNNYEPVERTLQVTVLKQPIVIGEYSIEQKYYDGTVNGKIASVTFRELNGNEMGATVTDNTVGIKDNYTATYDSANAGSGRTITIRNIHLNDASAANYVLTTTELIGSSQTIRPASVTAITVSGPQLVYNGSEQTQTATSVTATATVPDTASTNSNATKSVSFTLASGDYTITGNKGTKVGTYSMNVALASNGNFSTASTLPAGFTIAPDTSKTTSKTTPMTTQNVLISDKAAVQAVIDSINNGQTDAPTTYASILAAHNGLKTQITTAETAIDNLKLNNTAQTPIETWLTTYNKDTTAPDDTSQRTELAYYEGQIAALDDNIERMVKAELGSTIKQVKDRLYTYKITAGSGATYTKSSGKTLSFTANGAYAKFAKLLVDGKEVSTSKYSAKSGSTVVTLNNSYLQTLSNGTHTIQFVYTDADAAAYQGITGSSVKTNLVSFTVAKASTTPKTGDTIMTTVTVMTLSAAAIAAVLYRNKKKKLF